MAMLKKTRITKPDIVEVTLVVVLAIWVVALLWLINLALKSGIISLLAVDSLSMFALVFISVVVMVIAILLADIRKALGKK